MRRGTVTVVSAGNDDANLDGGEFTWPRSMAGVMTISATGPNDKRTFYSNYGTSEIEVAAPGGGYETLENTLEEDEDEVEWTFPTNLVLNAMDPDSYLGQLVNGAEYLYMPATSMATPQVSGAASLVRDSMVRPDATAKQVEDAIKDGAELVTGRDDEDLGARRLNAANAVE